MRFLAVMALALWPGILAAESFPALYDVTGVASDDVLNVRTGPAASNPIIGALSYHATGVEVIRLSDAGTWGLVNAEDRTGWVSMRFLRRQVGQEGWDFPARASCFGTEPFWDVKLRRGNPVEFTRAGDPTEFYAFRSDSQSVNRLDRHSFLADRAGTAMIGVLSRQYCNDGMSDREYGLSLELLIWRGAGFDHASGCCTLAR
jgi:uncharacterized membrane protein